LVERAKSGRFERMHYVHKSTFEMNPAISADFLEEQRREDPELYGREYLAEFIDGASSYLTSADVIACRRAENILQPSDNFRYVGALDPAYTLDNFAMAVAHRDSDKRIVIDGCWTWRKYGHDATLTEVAEIARRYRITSLRTDQASAVPIREGLARRGIDANYQPWTSESKVAAFTALKMGLNNRSVELPNDSSLIEELVSLEARPTPNGSTRIAAASSGHDDRAIAVAACVQALERPSDIFAMTVDWKTGLTAGFSPDGGEWQDSENPWTTDRGWEGGIINIG
jgi:phage terminase large subunit-like protein